VKTETFEQKTLRQGFCTREEYNKLKVTKMKKGSIKKFLITLVLTTIAVVLIGFALKYFQGGL